jgi:hypothetical protein
VKPKDLKVELNEQFHIKHEWLERSLTLSKIRGLKRDMLEVGLDEVCASDRLSLSG